MAGLLKILGASVIGFIMLMTIIATGKEFADQSKASSQWEHVDNVVVVDLAEVKEFQMSSRSGPSVVYYVSVAKGGETITLRTNSKRYSGLSKGLTLDMDYNPNTMELGNITFSKFK